MRWLLSLLLAWPLTLFGAVGDITGVAIETNGWQVLVYVNGLATNGTYASFGFGANNTVTGNEKLTVNLTSQGYDSTGTATTVPRTVYGTLRVRFPYPSDAFADTLVVGSDVRLRIALSDYVYAGDSNITANISAGLYTQGTANAAGTGLVVTNLSTQPYPKAIANWSWPGWNRETGPNMRLRSVGFHSSARNGKPLAAMKFIVTDESGDAVTNTVTEMTIDRTLPDIFPTGEYVSDFALSAFTDHDQLRCDFAAYPWVGDSSAVFDTRANVYTGHTPLPASITNFCDVANNYPAGGAGTPYIAVVDHAGNDTNGRITNVVPASVNSAHYFLTIARAATVLAATNNLAGVPTHNDVGGSTVYLRSGVTDWLGATGSYGGTPKCRISILVYPGDAAPVLSANTGNDDISDRIYLKGVTLAYTGSTTPFFGTDQFWLDQCRIDSSTSRLISTCPVFWFTHCAITNMACGLRPNTASEATAMLLRGNNLNGFNNVHWFKFTMGNTHPTTNNSSSIQIQSSVTGEANPDYQILYNNYFAGITGTGAVQLDVARNQSATNGQAIIQNILERCNGGAAALANFGSDDTLQYTNLLIWHNVIVGERIAGMGYNASGTAPAYRYLWSVRNNIFDVTGVKTDTSTTANGNRIGNWPIVWDVGGSGNVFIECRVTSGAGAFAPEFHGLNSSSPATVALPGTNIIAYARYVDRLAYDGISGPSTGGGNYRVQSHSPTLYFPLIRALAFDIEGNNRGLSDPAGAYASANPRKAAGFFSP